MSTGDLDDMATLLGDPDVMRYYPAPKTRPEAMQWIEWNRGLYQSRGYGLWILTLAESGEFVGDCGLTPQLVDGREELEVGYHVLPSLQGKGYATEAAAAARDFARDRLGARRLTAIIDPANRPSQRVAEKIGLHPEKRTATGRALTSCSTRPTGRCRNRERRGPQIRQETPLARTRR